MSTTALLLVFPFLLFLYVFFVVFVGRFIWWGTHDEREPFDWAEDEEHRAA